jgi:hypothetical protein
MYLMIHSYRVQPKLNIKLTLIWRAFNMLTVIETPVFQRMAVDVLPDTERSLLIAWMAGNPPRG